MATVKMPAKGDKPAIEIIDDKPDMQQAYFNFLAATGRHLIGIFEERKAELAKG